MITTRKVAIYVRVSTTNQAEEGYSIQGQIDSLIKY
ncbi:TPA: resolvase, partial [Streptococcus equi subsp. equi]|nr:resolvase [Streptococcus equi subsp. equi]